MNFHIVCLLLFLFWNNQVNSEEYIEVRRRTRNPMGTIVIATPNAQRRQGIGYSTTILHQTPGTTDQFAQSEIQVNLGNVNTAYHEPSASQNYIGQYSNNYHKIYEGPKPQVFQVKPQQAQQTVTSAPIHGGFSIGPQQEQNTFNVGYSIGFGSSGTETKSNYEAPQHQPQQSQRIQATLPRPVYNRAPDIVTGTPTTKVSKPKRMKLDKYRKDYNQQNYHHHHQTQQTPHQHQHQRGNQQYGASHPQHQHNDKANQHSDNKPQYSALTSSNTETYSYDANTNGPNKKQNDNSYGWINLSPSVEMASSTNHQYKTARGASLHNIQQQNLHHPAPVQQQSVHSVQQQHPQQQHSQIQNSQPQNVQPQQYSQPQAPQPQFLQQQQQQQQQQKQQHSQQFSQPHIQQQYPQQQISQALPVYPQSFDHDQALGNSQGFDHTNIINYEQPNSNERGGIDNSLSINDNYMQNSLITSTRQLHPQQSDFDQRNKEHFYKQYQPNTINWFNSQDAITQEIQQYSTIAPTPTSSNSMQKTVSNSYYFVNPSGQESQQAYAASQIQFDNDPIEQAQQMGNVISHQKHQNYYQSQPVQQSPKYRQQQKSNVSNNNNGERQHYQQQKHSGTIHSGAPAPTRVNQRFSNSATSYSAVQSAGQSQHSDQSHQISSYSKAPQEQIIKGKPKKPGVVRHPRLLAVEQQQQQQQVQVQSQSQNIPVTIVRNLSGSQSQINHAANINSALRPPAPNNNANNYRTN